MELGNYFKILSRHKLTLIIIPLITIIITYFLVRHQPDSYTSEAQIATGIVDKTQQALSNNNNEAQQESQIAQNFDNLIEIMRSKKMLDQVSYQLMIHDLTSKEPFRKPSKLFNSMDDAARAHALAAYKDFYVKHQELSLYNQDQAGLHNLLSSMKYDDESLLKTLNIYRAQSSDFIDVDFSTDDSELAAFVVNTLTQEFITYYNTTIKENQRRAIGFLGNLLQAKRDTLNAKIIELRNYKIKNRILSLPEQSRALYSQLADFETHLEQAQREAIANQAAIKNIDDHFNPKDRKYFENALVPVNQSIVNLTDQLKDLNQKYIQSDFNPAYKSRIDSLQTAVNEKIMQSSDKYITSPLANQQALVTQRLSLQVAYELAKNGIGSIQNELKRLNAELDGIVPHEAVVQQDESNVDVAQKEFLEILNKYNQTSLDSNYIGLLKQVEVAMPGIAEPSKKMLLVILSGIIMFVFCIVVFFFIYFFDTTIKTPAELANTTGKPVLGYLNLLSNSSIDLRQLWIGPTKDDEIKQFRNLMQSIRYEVDTDMDHHKILVINSLVDGEGKTFLATNLAYAYSLVNKKVLLIDGNFHSPGITKSVKSSAYIEDYFNGSATEMAAQAGHKIIVLSNKGGDGSLFEVSNEENITNKLNKLKADFDVIIIETSALNTLNKSKEWNTFADKILTVFESDKKITNSQQADIKYLKSLDGKFMGWVLNVVHKFTAEEKEAVK